MSLAQRQLNVDDSQVHTRRPPMTLQELQEWCKQKRGKKKPVRLRGYSHTGVLVAARKAEQLLDRGAYIPTQEEIRLGCLEIQATWSERERQNRIVGPFRGAWEGLNVNPDPVELAEVGQLAAFEKKLSRDHLNAYSFVR